MKSIIKYKKINNVPMRLNTEKQFYNFIFLWMCNVIINIKGRT
jgi:hypothetical protein